MSFWRQMPKPMMKTNIIYFASMYSTKHVSDVRVCCKTARMLCYSMRTRKTTNPFSILFDNTLRCLSMQSHDFDITDYIQSNGTLRIQYSIWKTSTFCCECMRFLHSFSLISLCGTPFSYVLSLRLSLYLRNKSKIRFKVMNLPKHRESHVSPACLAFSVPSNSILFVRNELFSLSLFSLNNETRLLSNPISALIVFSFSP